MGILDSIGQLLGTSANTKGINKATKQLMQAYGPAAAAAGGALTAGLGGAIGGYQTALGQETGTLQGAQPLETGAIQTGAGGAVDTLMGQEQQAQQLAQGGIDPYTSLWSQYAPGAQ